MTCANGSNFAKHAWPFDHRILILIIVVSYTKALFALEKAWRLGKPLLPSMLTIILSRFQTSIIFFLNNSYALHIYTSFHDNCRNSRALIGLYFYGQYADRHMNLKFKRRVREREREIRQFVIVRNKSMSVFNAPVLLLTMNFVITLSK